MSAEPIRRAKSGRYVNLEEATKYYSSDNPCDFAQFQCIREKLSTFETVEIVRCKECKYLSTLRRPRGKLSCTFHGGRGTYPDSYCSDGQTKENQTDDLYAADLITVITHKDGRDEAARIVLANKTSRLECMQVVYADLSEKIRVMSAQCMDFADNPYHKYFEVSDGEKKILYKYNVYRTS